MSKQIKSHSFLSIGLCCLFFTGLSFGQNVTTPRPVSPAAELTQRIGLTDITVNYSRPRVTLNGSDRTGKIWGQLVPYGFNKINFAGQGEIPWRAGANENTTIRFTDDVKIEGKDLPAGIYGLHMAVYEDGRVTLIFSKNSTSWGSFFYDPKDDVLRVDVVSRESSHTEVLTYSFIDYGTDFGVLALTWEKKQIPFRIEIDTHKVVLQSFRNELRSVPGFGWQGFQTAANYCFTNNINHQEALGWAEIAVTRNRSFPTLSTKAGLLVQTGKQVEADKVMDEAAALATTAELNALGYQLLGLKRFDKALEYFKLNVQKNPENPNVYDSLGEAYMITGNREKAIENLRKSLSLNPPPNVRANSEKLLKELGVEIVGEQ